MKRREFIQSAPLTLAILPCLPAPSFAVADDAFRAELYRRFENLPTLLKSDGAGFNLATAVLLLSKPDPKIEFIERKQL